MTEKTIKLGIHKDAEALREALKKAGCLISIWADEILDKVSVKETELDIVVRSVADLGFERGARYDAICARAKDLGLELCPAEVGPQLRLQYKDQPVGEWLLIAMEPITDSDGYPRVFSVNRGHGGLWLNAYYGYPDYFWGSAYQFVFVPRK